MQCLYMCKRSITKYTSLIGSEIWYIGNTITEDVHF